MTYHGGGPVIPRNDKPPHEPVICVAGAREPKGFRHYALRGRAHAPAAANRQAEAERAARLEMRMTAAMTWNAAPADLPGAAEPMVVKAQPDLHDNPYIPSGYTYFAQFVAHDMVLTRVPFWATQDLERDTANDRDTRLRLDALYGAGPVELPSLYAPADASDLSRGKLQIGRSAPITQPDGTLVCPFRDIGRLKLANTTTELPGLTEALVADQRNDDHAIISQLTMVFCHLHNIFIDRQAAIDADDPLFSFTRDTARLFANARDATTLIYRHLVRGDLLKRLLHPLVYTYYTTASPKFLDTETRGAGVPLEFSHAAFRFGHAMVRESYQVNDGTLPPGRFLRDALERFSSARNIHMQPMAASWVIQWSKFFAITGKTDPAHINLSRRIGPHTPLSLFGPSFNAIDPSLGRGIFYRDLISAELADLWGVPDLLAAMRDHEGLGPIIARSSFLQGTAWRDAIAAWLPAGVFNGVPGPWDGMADTDKQQDIAAIAANPPLPFFVLFEAATDPDSQGCRLGPFGSILVADTLFAELADKTWAERQADSLSGQLRALHPAFADPVFDAPLSMASVISFVDRALQASPDAAMKFPSLL